MSHPRHPPIPCRQKRAAHERVVRFTGNETPRNARVLLLDAGGKVVWFHDRGDSPRVLLQLDREVRARTKQEPIKRGS